ncbi:NADP-dependent oxidoreductase [Jongsikchunia kroppenstedtii]|uniref:NADP-dependent oxidoreductase n=1 Tax=Jongsikchunia kroppenstedtii TaxID=1121721 RepID=UPI0003621DAB|nr:NADP-dependent oxidoreductase [Jongsikchunia kroppenstedtii]
MTTTTRIVLAERPVGEPKDSDFRVETVDLPEPGPGEALLETLYLSLDPYMRGRMSAAKSYAKPVEIGQAMVGATVSRVLESTDDTVAVGDVVLGYGGWQTHSVESTSYLRVLNPDALPVTTALGVLGMPGFTAYAGMHNIGQPKAGETVVVAAATGPVGSMVGQLARLAGARAVGIAGGAAKVAMLTDEFGFDAAIDHRADDFAEQLAAATPDGIDVYFENVGGKVFDTVLPRMNLYGRIPVCGLVSGYNATALPDGPDRMGMLMGRILTSSLLVRGFIQSEFAPTQMATFLSDIGTAVANGSIRYREDIVDGFDQTIDAFRGLLTGRNVGKLIVRVAG